MSAERRTPAWLCPKCQVYSTYHTLGSKFPDVRICNSCNGATHVEPERKPRWYESRWAPVIAQGIGIVIGLGAWILLLWGLWVYLVRPEILSLIQEASQ